jgi:deoxyribonuclease IV
MENWKCQDNFHINSNHLTSTRLGLPYFNLKGVLMPLKFGCSGVPHSTPAPGKRDQGLKHSVELGLGANELALVQVAKMNPKDIELCRKVQQETSIVITAHGPYYVNLNAREDEKRVASRKRILDTARICNAVGGYSIVFHAAFYFDDPKDKVYDEVKREIEGIMQVVHDEKLNVWIRPETTGKPSQFGTVTEIVRLAQEIPSVAPCVDFAHLHARSNGKYNTKAEFKSVLDEIASGLGEKALNEMHIHLSGINYGAKGEKNHLEMRDSDYNYRELFEVLAEYNVEGVLICESPNLEDDAIFFQNEYNKLIGK